MSHRNHSLYVENEGCFKQQTALPLPPAEGFPHPVRITDPHEPKFSPSVHLNLSPPEYVVVFPSMLKVRRAPPVTDRQGSTFAFSGPFQLLSEEGIRVVRSIVKREEHRANVSSRGTKRALRGLYYSSPFIRDLQNCPEVLDMFHQCVGEQLLPHFCFSNSPQVNLSSPGAVGPVDHWHNDSIAYAGVVVISDMEGMEGGDLELFKGDKEVGMQMLRSGKMTKEMIETVSYENPGKMILTHGSEVLHHVTPVTSDHVRLSLIFGLTPANAFQPPCSILNSFALVDWATGVAPYEFYREKAWQASHVLQHLAEKTTFTRSGEDLARKLRSVTEELVRAAHIIDGTVSDAITFFDETKNSEELYYEKEA